MRPVVGLVIVGLAAAVNAGCSDDSKADRAKSWVTANGGSVGAGESGWSASRGNWTGTWPWPAANVAVGCAPDRYGGTTYVQIGGSRYWLSESNGYPPDGGFYKSSAATIATDVAAQVEWSTRSADLCGISS